MESRLTEIEQFLEQGGVVIWLIAALSVLTLLYLGSASLAPSPARARADGGVVRDV